MEGKIYFSDNIFITTDGFTVTKQGKPKKGKAQPEQV